MTGLLVSGAALATVGPLRAGAEVGVTLRGFGELPARGSPPEHPRATAGAGVSSGAAPCQRPWLSLPGTAGWAGIEGGRDAASPGVPRHPYAVQQLLREAESADPRGGESCLLLIAADRRSRRYCQNEIRSGLEWWLELTTTPYCGS